MSLLDWINAFIVPICVALAGGTYFGLMWMTDKGWMDGILNWMFKDKEN